jgi:outer membrane protein TolC
MRNAWFLLFAIIPATAVAQTRGPRTPAAPSPSPPTEGAPRESAMADAGPEPTLNDPMLVALPHPRRTIANWEDALGLVRSRSVDLRVAFDEVTRAEGQTRAALGAVLPSITGSGAYVHQFITTTTPIAGFNPANPTVPIPENYTAPQADVLAGSLLLTQTIFNVQAWHAVGTAQVAADASRLSLEDTKRSIALGAATALIGVVTAERVADLNRSGLRQSIERYQIAQRKRQLGGGTVLDVARGRRDVEAARAALLGGDEALLRAREALGLALGLPEPVGVAPNVAIEDVERSCRAVPSIDERADIAALRKRVEVADRNVTDVYEQFLPTVVGSGTVVTTNQNYLGSYPNTTVAAQAALSVPIWDGGIRYGNLRQARALRGEAEQTLEGARRQVSVQLEQADRGVILAQHERDVARAARTLAAETDRLTRLAYETGQGTSLDLVVAAAELRQAEINLAVQDFGVVRAQIVAALSRAKCTW